MSHTNKMEIYALIMQKTISESQMVNYCDKNKDF